MFVTSKRSRIVLLSILSLCVTTSLIALVYAAGEATPEKLSLVDIRDDGITVEIQPPTSKSGLIEAELYDIEDRLIAKVMKRHEGGPTKINFSAIIKDKDAAGYYLKYRYDTNESFQKRSLVFLSEVLQTTVLGQREYMSRSEAVIRVMVKDRSSGNPIPNAQVTTTLYINLGNIKDFPCRQETGQTDAEGELLVTLNIPKQDGKDAKLKVEVKSGKSTDVVEESIQIVSATRTMLTTDKPLYQPGQIIHIRSLSLQRPQMTALANTAVIFEVEDAKGNKVFKKNIQSDDFGIASVDFVLADELNMGAWKIRAMAAGATEEKTVTVARYVLPKFKVKLDTDKPFYQPGETVKGEIQVDYFFGKPVSSGKVSIQCAKFDLEYTDFQQIEGKTDDQGHYSFEVKLPEHFVGQPLEAGKASAKFEVSVIDTADHKETITKNISVTANPILVTAIPEAGDLIPNLENKIYIVTTYADATPASCKVTIKTGDQNNTLETDTAGFGEINLKPEDSELLKLELSAQDTRGQRGKASIELKHKAAADEQVLLRSDKALYQVGEPVNLSIFSTRQQGIIYLDVIKDKQTTLTRSLELVGGRAHDTLTLDAIHAGTIQINAWLIGANGVIVRDKRLVIVDPANDLKIKITADQDSYLPAEQARLKFKITDKRNKGVAGALGVMVVDEAVFALQEMQPGLEKIYFYLEKEIATPRYEVHGWDLDDCLKPRPLTPEVIGQNRDTAARVLLASAEGVDEFSLNVNTLERDNKLTAMKGKYLARFADPMSKKYEAIFKALEKYSARHKQDTIETGVTLDTLIKEDFLTKQNGVDPWGTAMTLEGNWCTNCRNYHGFTLKSAGLDGQWNTIDDFSTDEFMSVALNDKDGNLRKNQWFRQMRQRGFGMGGMGGMGGGLEPGIVANEAVVFDMAMPMEATFEAKREKSTSSIFDRAGGSQPVRVRNYFPETLYFNPAVITDRRGNAVLNIPLADSITTWRLSTLASTATGQLGSTTAPLRVFQEFFVDIDFPVALTQNDLIHVPVAIYNYLDARQTIELEVTKEPWFELQGLDHMQVTLDPEEVRAVYFPIIAKKVGYQTFTITARGSSKSDAVARQVEIVPDGKECILSYNGRLKDTATHTILIPDSAIEGASKIFVKVYPGVLSQIVEGLDGMLRMPGGCFEQTSSSTYPNILILDYMKTTGKITPELQMKAEGFINNGYQRLVSFEVPGGGFEWFGKAPAHKILTAYGLMEFYDMSKVYQVDPAIIARTQYWLVKQQEQDGSWKPSEGGIAEGAINKYTDDLLRNTAYITWALASTGYKGNAVQKGAQYIRNHLDDMKDVFTRTLVVNALATLDPEDKTTLDTLRTLHDLRKEKDDLVWWETDKATPTNGTGLSGDIETTALAIQAFIRCGREFGTVGKAVSYLVKNKDSFGSWQSTQATIQSLRAMLMAESGATQKTSASITISLNGKPMKTLTVNESNSDVLQLVDLKDQTQTGDHQIAIDFKGEGSMMYQVVGRYYLPWPDRPRIVEEPMSIKLVYDRTELATNDIITATATITNNRPGKAKMVMIDLGLPPGFTLIADKLDKLVESSAIEKYNTTGRQIIIYLREVDNKQPVTVSYQLLAKYPLKAQTQKSVVYEYYNPDIRAESQPVALTVNQQ